MKNRERTLNWLRLASLAPSAANLQPWSYRAEEQGDGYQISVKICPDVLANPSTLDPYFATATIAIGCFVKNLEFAARLDGYKCLQSEFTGETPATWNWKYVFKSESGLKNEPYGTEKILIARVSNRTSYLQTPVALEHFRTAKRTVEKNPDVKLLNVTSQRKQWTRMLSRLESIRLNEDVLRHELFAEFKLESEINESPVGLPINTISNSSFQRLLIVFMKKIPVSQLLLKFGGSHFFSWLSLSRPLFHSGDIFILQISSKNPISGVPLGKALEELWLLWTYLGYSVQLIALPILIYGNNEGLLGSRLSPTSRQLLENIKIQSQSELGIDLSLMTVILRVGRATNSTPNSPRRKAQL